MKRLSINLLMACILLFACKAIAVDAALPAGVDPNWTLCMEDKECVEVRMPCGLAAVNKKFKVDAEQYLQSRAYEALECKQPSMDERNGHNRLICDHYVSCDSDAGVCASNTGTCRVLLRQH